MDVKPEAIYSWVKNAPSYGCAGGGARRQVGVKVISFDEMWTYAGFRRGDARNSRWIWTAALGDAAGNRWNDFEVGNKSESAFLRLLERLPDTERYRIDAYGAYGCLPVNKHVVWKCGAVNGNEGLHSVLRGILNGLVKRTKGYSKTDGMLVLSHALIWLKLGWI